MLILHTQVKFPSTHLIHLTCDDTTLHAPRVHHQNHMHDVVHVILQLRDAHTQGLAPTGNMITYTCCHAGSCPYQECVYTHR